MAAEPLPPSVGSLAIRGFEAVAALLRWSLVIAMLVMLSAISVQVIGRYVFMRAPSWSEELAVLAFSWATMGGLALGVREGFHVALTLILERLPERGRRVWTQMISVATMVLGLYLVWSGLRFLDVTFGSVSAAIEYPIEILNAMAPIAGGLIALFAVERVFWPLEAGEPG